jgi:hypothetical protein
MKVRIVVPCWPIVKYFIQHEFGDPVKLNLAHPLSKTICLFLESKKNYRFRDCAAKCDYEEQFVIELSSRMRQLVGHHLSPTRVQEINTIIKGYFYNRMFDHLDVCLLQDASFVIKQGIIDYLNIKSVPTDTIQVETVIRAYQRYRTKTQHSFIKTHWVRSIPKSEEYLRKTA